MTALPMRSAAADSPEHLRAIGLITVNFAMLEAALDIAICVMLGLDQKTSRTITGELVFSKKLELLRALAQAKIENPSTIEDANKLLKEVQQVGDRRNDITHSGWGIAHTQGTRHTTLWRFSLTAEVPPEFEEVLPPDRLVRVKARGRGKKGFTANREALSINDLQKVADHIAELASDVLIFFPQAQHQTGD